MDNFKMFPVQTFESESLALQMRAMAVGSAIFDIALKERLFQEKDRQAVAYSMVWERGVIPLFVVKLGTTFPDHPFGEKCFGLAPEKPQRAIRHSHNTSYLTRDKISQWGGGIVLSLENVRSKWGLGVSGEKELEDEGLGIVFAQYIFSIPTYTTEMLDIMDCSGSRPFTDTLLKAVIPVIGEPA